MIHFYSVDELHRTHRLKSKRQEDDLSKDSIANRPTNQLLLPDFSVAELFSSTQTTANTKVKAPSYFLCLSSDT